MTKCRVMSKYLRTTKLFVIALFSLAYAVIHLLPGIRFDLYGRKLALKGALKGSPNRYLPMLLNPVSCIRYFEFDFARRCLSELGGGRLLDVSSPRLLPLWAADVGGFQVTMVNPDLNDLAESMRLCSFTRKGIQVQFDTEVDAIHLPYPDDSFDVLTSISVIEHINGDGDGLALDEFIRVVRPTGKIILTFPVSDIYYEEYRPFDIYGTQERDIESGLYFFQRFYDKESISSRLLDDRKVRVIREEYFVESSSGWFDEYTRRWLRNGLNVTTKDPWLMCKYFLGPTDVHPEDRMGNCHLVLEVIGGAGYTSSFIPTQTCVCRG